MSKNTVEFNKVQESSRSMFPSIYFGNPLFDLNVFKVADKLLPEYKGGYWDYVLATVRNGKGLQIATVPFFQWEKATLIVNPFSSEEFKVDDTLAGMIVTLYAVNLRNEYLGERDKLKEKDYEQWRSLRDATYDYATATGQMNQAFGMID